MLPRLIEGGGLARPVADVPGRAHGGGMTGDGFGPRAVAAQHGGQTRGQGDNAGVLARPGGMVEAGDEVGTLGTEPGQRLLLAG